MLEAYKGLRGGTVSWSKMPRPSSMLAAPLQWVFIPPFGAADVLPPMPLDALGLSLPAIVPACGCHLVSLLRGQSQGCFLTCTLLTMTFDPYNVCHSVSLLGCCLRLGHTSCKGGGSSGWPGNCRWPHLSGGCCLLPLTTEIVNSPAV